MKTNFLFLVIFVASLLTSCSVYKARTSKTMDINGMGIIHKPVLVDLNVNENKVTVMVNGEKYMPLEIVKQNAVAKALSKESADVLIEPTFEIETYRKRFNVTVTGWSATYKNFRAMEVSDTSMLQIGFQQKPVVNESYNGRSKKNRKTR